MTDMDWAAAQSSEVLMNYLRSELKKEAEVKPAINEKEIMEKFLEFEASVQSNPQLRAAFKDLQVKFATNPEFVKKCDQTFVQAVMILDLEDE